MAIRIEPRWEEDKIQDVELDKRDLLQFGFWGWN